MLPRNPLPPAAVSEFIRERTMLVAGEAPGPDPALRLARAADELFVALAGHAAARLPRGTHWSLLAVGGYGAGALLPASDLDILVLSDARPAALKGFVEEVFYPLWDAGLAVGHQVRSPREQRTASREDHATLTALLTARVIAGDAAKGAGAIEQAARDAGRDAARGTSRSRVLQALRGRERPGSPFLLEPDLKDGAGGRRDFDELTWTAAVLTGARQGDPGALVACGILREAELTALRAAAREVAEARWKLHAAGFGNLMTLEAAERLALPATHIQAALATTHEVLLTARERLASTGGRGGAGAGGASGPLSASHPADQIPLTPGEVFALIDAGDAEALERAAWSGRLEELLPGYRELMILRRPGLAHTRTVGAHSIASAVLATSPPGEVAARSAEAVADPRPLRLAALLHDAGKVIPGEGHAGRGAAAARGAAVRFGIAEADDDVCDLVRLHLLLAETAARADLDDEDAVLRCARAVGTRGLVAPLHLLTIADSRATGPAAWTEWHEALLGKLVARLDAALSPDIDGAGIAARAEAVRATALALVPADSPESAFISSAPLRFLGARTPDRIARDAALVARLAVEHAPGAFELEICAGPLPGTYALTIVAGDRDRLFELLAGVLALSGLDILAAGAMSAGPGLALDTFTVQSASLAAPGTSTWAQVERLLSAALTDRLALGVRLAERRRHYRHERTGPLSVEIATDDPYAAVLHLRAADRVGLLYDVARAIDEAGLHIRSVIATTRNGIADDTFRLVDDAGEAPVDAGLLGKLRMHLREIG